MNLRQDVVDIYTKTSMYYIRLQYLLVCYTIVLVGAFFVLPLPREMGINGFMRLLVGSLLYIGFAVLLVYSPKLLHLTFIGKWFSGDDFEEKIVEKLNQMSEADAIELEEGIFAQGKTSIKIFAKQDQLTLNRKQTIATNVFFQCMLIELFCLVVLINNDHSLLISNPITQQIADNLLPYTQQTEEQARARSGFFSVYIWGKETDGSIPFAQFNYMAESIFFLYSVFLISYVIRMFSMFSFSRPLFVRDDVFSFLKRDRYVWAFLGTLVMFVATLVCAMYMVSELSFHIGYIEDYSSWIYFSVMIGTVMLINFLIFFRFIEDWYKKIFGKF
ncbi:MAG: hypothetical protein IK065_04790 [Neisseriaceae bacterium]|nr:hypothetical protein [Neisseriaceae bacterium]